MREEDTVKTSVKFSVILASYAVLVANAAADSRSERIAGTYLVQSAQTCILSASRATPIANPPSYTVSNQFGVNRIAFSGPTVTAVTTSSYVVIVNPNRATWTVPQFKMSAITPAATVGSVTDEVVGKADATFQVDRSSNTIQILNTVTTWTTYTGTTVRQETPVDVRLVSFDDGDSFANVLDARTIRTNTYTPLVGNTYYNDAYCDRLMSGQRISKRY
jgi:hypothetical protein